jgi:predicted transcriptional regulator
VKSTSIIVAVRLPLDITEAVDALAAVDRASRSATIRTMIARALRQQGQAV